MENTNRYMNMMHLLGVLIIFFVVNFLSGMVYLWFFREWDAVYVAKICYLPNFILIILLTVLYQQIICKRTKQPLTPLPKRGSFDGRYVLAGLAYLFVISVVIEPVQAVMGADMKSYIAMYTTGEVWQNVLLTILIAPIVEEIFFRGMVLRGLLNRYSDRIAIILSALVFALVHMSLVQLLPGFFIGLMLGYVYVRTRRSLSTVILIHLFNNLISYIFILYGFGEEMHIFENLFAEKWVYYVAYLICLFFLGLLLFRVWNRQSDVSEIKR